MVKKLLQILSHCSLALLSENLKYLLDAVLGQDYFIFDDVGCWINSKKGCNGINNFGIDHDDIMKGTGTKNQVVPSHGVLIGYFIIVVDVGRIP